MDRIYKQKDLPLADLEKLGLYQGGYLNIDKENLNAMLAGRRTDMMTFRDLKADGFRIEQLDARLSLQRQPDGTLALKVHPIYKEAQKHAMLLNREAEDLQAGKLANVEKSYTDPDGKKKTLIIEYDKETKEYVSYDPDKVQAPDFVDNMPLTADQKDKFRRGKVVELEDGTQLQHKASERRGVLSNRTGLVLSVLLDGGISYLLVTGIGSLLKKQQSKEFSKGYEQAKKDMQEQERQVSKDKQEMRDQESRQQQQRNHHEPKSRGYGRGFSR